MLRLLGKIVGRKEGETEVEVIVIDVMRTAALRKGVGGLGGFSSTYVPTKGFYAAVFGLVDVVNSQAGERRDMTELVEAIILKLFPNDEAGIRAVKGAKMIARNAMSFDTLDASIENFFDLLEEVQLDIREALNRYSQGPRGISYMTNELVASIQKYL